MASMLSIVLLSAYSVSEFNEQPNVLMICVDDLRPELGCYGNADVISPNIDRIAAKGLIFNNAHCQTAICMPSRVSVLSGYRPETIGMARDMEDKKIPDDVISLPQLFNNAGYSTVSIGKVYHKNDDDSQAWTRRYTDTFYKGKNGYSAGYQLPSNIQIFDNYFEKLNCYKLSEQSVSELKNGVIPDAVCKKLKPLIERKIEGGNTFVSELIKCIGEEETAMYKQLIMHHADLPRPLSVEVAEAPDEAYPDGVIGRCTIEELRKFKKSGKPFFLAAGFYRPHLPFAIPRKYWDLYEENKIKTASNPEPVLDGLTAYNWDELRRYGDIPKQGPLSEKKAKELIQAYYASVSFTDSQIGKVMTALKNLGLDKNTIVVLWGDHGWNLGEHGWWCKHTNYEISNRTAMIISTPGIKEGMATDALVELVDIYPSLCELAHIKAPSYLEGLSFVPLIENPDRAWKNAVFCKHGNAKAIRTIDFRLIQHNNKQVELFDYATDPDENINIASNPEYAETKMMLLNQLMEGWRAALPEEPGNTISK